MNKNTTIETCCYVICLGAFGIFIRWMQLMLAYNDEDMVNPSFWNIAVILIIAASAFVALKFIKRFQDKYYYVPHDYCQALKNKEKIHTICRWSISCLMIIGSLLLLMQCEIDQNANFLRVLSVAGIVTGFCFGLGLTIANRPAVYNRKSSTVLMTVPIFFMAFWVVTIYKQNSINPEQWDFVVELASAIFAMLGFFRIAGFAYGVENEWRSFFYCFLAGPTCLMNLADERYIGEQIMFASVSLMFIMYIWLMLENMKKGKPIEKDISI